MTEFIGGTAMYVSFIVAGGTINLTSKYTELSFNQSAEEVDTTAGNEVWKKLLPGDASWEASYKGWFDDAASTLGTADLNKMLPRTTGLLSIGPLGSAAGKPKLGGSVMINALNAEMQRAEPVSISIDFVGIGQPYWNFGSAW